METELIRQFQEPGCEVLLGAERIVFELPSEIEALHFIRKFASLLPIWTKKLGGQVALVVYPECTRPYRFPIAMAYEKEEFMSTPIIATPGLQIAQMKLSKPILEVFEHFLEYPERKLGLVRLHDERQIAVSEASSALIKNATAKEAVQRKRHEYWYLPDLEEFTTVSRQRLEANNVDSILEFSWRGVDKTGQHWRKFTNRYRLVTDAYSIAYHVSENVGVEQIAQPYPVTN